MLAHILLDSTSSLDSAFALGGVGVVLKHPALGLGEDGGGTKKMEKICNEKSKWKNVWFSYETAIAMQKVMRVWIAFMLIGYCLLRN